MGMVMSRLWSCMKKYTLTDSRGVLNYLLEFSTWSCNWFSTNRSTNDLLKNHKSYLCAMWRPNWKKKQWIILQWADQLKLNASYNRAIIAENLIFKRLKTLRRWQIQIVSNIPFQNFLNEMFWYFLSGCLFFSKDYF